jgi:DNA polymerase elongation subunit (family B)
MPEIRRYLRADCVTLWKAVEAFTTTYGRSLTLAGAAMKVWKDMCPEDQPESSKMFYDFNKEFYYGGRVQCFASGIIDKDFYFVDINSAYPFAMLHNHPISTTYTMEKPEIGDAIIPQSLYHIRARSRGALPWREDSTSPLHFFDDAEVRDHCVTGWELAAGMETGTVEVVKIHSRIDFLKEMNFTEYVMLFYNMKKAAKKGSAEYIFAKLFMNSLYGKYAADPSNYCNYGIIPTKFITECEKSSEVKLGRNSGPWAMAGLLGPWAVMAGKDMATGENNATHSKYFNVATAASITGFVRAYLWRHICKIRKGGGQMLYCDTDSIAFHYPGAEKALPFTFDKELGNWTLEGTFDTGGIAGKKLYAFRDKHIKDETGKAKWKTASKGVRLKEDEIMAIAQGAELTYLNPVPCFSPLNRGAPKFIHRTVRRTHKP